MRETAAVDARRVACGSRLRELSRVADEDDVVGARAHGEGVGEGHLSGLVRGYTSSRESADYSSCIRRLVD